MGETAPRRSTLVSRLPIFRRSSSKRQDSLPSSPSSGGVGNGVHTSSPSSTNSSSGSTGKRRSLFRAPSLSFSSKRHGEPRVHPTDLDLTPPPPPPQGGTDANGNDRQTATATGDDGGIARRAKTRHSFGFGSHRQKKITRSQTEDFNKASSSSAANRNVFINCISSSGTNEGDDSGFLDDYSNGSRRPSRQKKPTLPKSFSAHHRFSRTSDQHAAPPEVSPEPPTSAAAVAAADVGLTPGSWPGDPLGVGGESSLQSPVISEDRTTAVTPSEFVPVTEDSVSEADALPTPSPAAAAPPGPPSLPGHATEPAVPDAAAVVESLSMAVSISQVFFTPAQSSTDKPLLPDASTANNTDYETAVSLSEPETAVPCLPPQRQHQPPPPEKERAAERKERAAERKEAQEKASGEEEEEEKEEEERKRSAEERKAGDQTETTSESEACVARSEGSERRGRNMPSVQEVGRGTWCGHQEPRASNLRRPHAASTCSSVSPYHGVMRMERRLRSSSEGAGGPRIHGNHGDAPGNEGCGLLKHRNNSSSSKLGSLDMLNNLGSSELDEDDLMLDLDLSDDQRHRHVSREDSSQSLASCLNLLPSPMEPSGDRLPGRDATHRQPCRPTSLLPTDWSSALGLAREEEVLPLRLMQQDCTAVKTLLLRLRRALQESTETSPASSLQSLPISPCSEKSLPFKDLGREEALLQQLREKDELILRLRTELESAKAALKTKDCQMTDHTTQTEHTGPEASHPGRWAGLGSSSSSSSSSSLALRERRGVRVGGVVLGGDLSSHLPYHYPPLHGLPPASQRHTAREERHCLGVQAQPSVRTPVSSPGTSLNPAPVARQPESQFSSSSSESLTVGSGGAGGLSVAARRGGEGHLPPSQIPRAVGGAASAGSTSSSSHHGPAGHGSPCPSVSSSDGLSPPPRCPSSATSSSSSTSTLFAGRLGQPPRGPLSLHSYSRKNVFLQHSLHTAELQALAQRDV